MKTDVSKAFLFKAFCVKFDIFAVLWKQCLLCNSISFLKKDPGVIGSNPSLCWTFGCIVLLL